jgi:hypothetical protein
MKVKLIGMKHSEAGFTIYNYAQGMVRRKNIWKLQKHALK